MSMRAVIGVVVGGDTLVVLMMIKVVMLTTSVFFSHTGKPMNLTFDSGRKGPGFGRLPPTGPKAASLINRIASAPLIDRVAR